MKYIAVFLTGAAGYSLLEVIWRGYTHWTMSVTGGICLVLIYLMNESLVHASIWSRCLMGASIITSAELLAGVTVNIILKWHVWDYSSIPFNLMGQICLPYSVLWYFLCLPVIGLCTQMSRFF